MQLGLPPQTSPLLYLLVGAEGTLCPMGKASRSSAVGVRSRWGECCCQVLDNINPGWLVVLSHPTWLATDRFRPGWTAQDRQPGGANGSFSNTLLPGREAPRCASAACPGRRERKGPVTQPERSTPPPHLHPVLVTLLRTPCRSRNSRKARIEGSHRVGSAAVSLPRKPPRSMTAGR